MKILKKLIRLQSGLLNFRNSESVNILGRLSTRKDPLIPYDKDMLGAVVVSEVMPYGGLEYLVFKKAYLGEEKVELSSVLADGELSSIYQQWATYPQSPLLTSDFPYQTIIEDSFDDNGEGGIKAGVTLYMVKQKFWDESAYNYSDMYQPSAMLWHEYVLTNGEWILRKSDTITKIGNTNLSWAVRQQNCDIYTSSSLTTIRYTKTTD